MKVKSICEKRMRNKVKALRRLEWKLVARVLMHVSDILARYYSCPRCVFERDHRLEQRRVKRVHRRARVGGTQANFSRA
jgi:hypothetical protein